jgi:hypothetical protein
MTPEQISAEIEAPLAALPHHLQEGLREYLVARQPVGGFLTAVLANDLSGAVLRADPVSEAALKDLARFLHNHAPPDAHGSAEAVHQWLARGR